MEKKTSTRRDEKLSRRDFMGAAATVAAFTIVPRHVLGGPFTETVVMGNLAVLNPDKVLQWDGENMRMTNDEAANAFVRPKFREGWSL